MKRRTQGEVSASKQQEPTEKSALSLWTGKRVPNPVPLVRQGKSTNDSGWMVKVWSRKTAGRVKSSGSLGSMSSWKYIASADDTRLTPAKSSIASTGEVGVVEMEGVFPTCKGREGTEDDAEDTQETSAVHRPSESVGRMGDIPATVSRT